MYSSFVSLTVEKTISYYYLLFLLVPIISYYSFFEKSTPYETVTKSMKSTQNLSPGRFWHAEAEFEVKKLQNFHPDLEMKENDLQICFLLIRSSGYPPKKKVGSANCKLAIVKYF